MRLQNNVFACTGMCTHMYLHSLDMAIHVHSWVSQQIYTCAHS